MNKLKNIFIGGAWPYANGSLHLGHIAALLGADVLARYYRLKGNNVLYVSGSDCHGTPITVAAEKQGVNPVDIANKYDKEFRHDLIDRLGFSFDLFSKTIDKKHQKTVQEIFLKLLDKKLIYNKTQELPFCDKCNRFLPDRYVEGVCPHCGFVGARGDQCDNCGKLLDAKELKNPVCKNCGGTPKWRKSEHFFLKLSAFEEQLKNWIKPQTYWRANVYKFTLAMLDGGLKDRAITRDVDWGVDVPVKGFENKRIYVWFEAVCGYLSASKKWAKQTNNKWENFWSASGGLGSECRHYYVYGKDNIIFHTIIWPAILMGVGGLNLPTDMISSEYLNLEGKQLSTSRNWAVWAPDFLDKFDADSLRYFLIANGPETTDVNFTWKTYQERNNSELVGNFGNFINRIIGFSYKNFGNEIPKASLLDEQDEEFLSKCQNVYQKVGKAIEGGNFRHAFKLVFNIAEEGNRYIDQKSPWTTIKTDKKRTQTTINVCLQVIYNLRVLINPFLPFSSQKISELFNVEKDNFQWDFQNIPDKAKLQKSIPLYQKIEDEVIEEELNKLRS
ncbi:MAG: methionine--tRNA ligase [bacterium]